MAESFDERKARLARDMAAVAAAADIVGRRSTHPLVVFVSTFCRVMTAQVVAITGAALGLAAAAFAIAAMGAVPSG